MKYVVVTHRTTGETKKCYLSEAAKKIGMCERTMSDLKSKYIRDNIATNTRYFGKWKIFFQVE